MTMLLASVTGLEEAELALVHGADIIDLKDPAKGALGALDPSLVRAVTAALARRRATSAVTGDLPMQADRVVAAARRMAETGVDFVKVGLPSGAGRADCIRALSVLAERTRLVGVMFADDAPDFGLLPLMAASGFAGAMLDTARKGAGRLLDHADLATLQQFVHACHTHGLVAGLAGSLEAPDVPRLLLLAPDYLGFRGALCAHCDRKAALDARALAVIRGLIPADPRGAKRDHAPPQRVGHRNLATRELSEMHTNGDVADRLLVRDLILPVRIGAYANEHGLAQNVCFNVDVELTRPIRPAQDMSDVFSYDIVRDGIGLIAADGHISLVETLAERIASFVLGFARVCRVTVRIEKLQAGPGRVGVEITRQRMADAAKVYHFYPTAVARGSHGSAD